MLVTVVFGLFAVANSLPAAHQFNAWKQTHGKVSITRQKLQQTLSSLNFIGDIVFFGSPTSLFLMTHSIT